MVYLMCVGWDWYNSASNHSAVSDAQRIVVVNGGLTQDNIVKERSRLDALYSDLNSRESRPLGMIEALLAEKRIKNATLWEVSRQCTTIHVPRKRGGLEWPGEKAFCIDYLDAKGKLEIAKDRDKAKSDRAALGNEVRQETSRSGSQINNTEAILGWIGFKGGEDRIAWANTIASMISWGNSLFMTILGSMAPHFAFIYFFKTLDPAIAEHKRLERARAKAVKKAEKEAARSAHNEVMRKAREEKEAVAREKREAVLAAEKQARDRNEAVPEAPVTDEPQEAKIKPVSKDPTLDAFCTGWLQDVDGEEVEIKSPDIFKGPWDRFCEVNDLAKGTPGALTKRLQQRYKWRKGGGQIWFKGVTLRAKSEPPRLKIVPRA